MTGGGTRARVAGWVRGWEYWPALRHPVLRRLLPGYALSALGDGMSAVAVGWLALRLAPPGRQGLLVGAALAAYTLPGALGMALFGRWLRRHRGIALAGADAVLRAVALGAVGVLAALHLLTPPAYVSLLGVSSLLHAWGSAGQYTLIADILPPRHRVAGNGLLGITAEITLIGGPALAGVLSAVAGPAVVITIDAATFAVLAVSYARAAPLVPPGAGRGAAARQELPEAGGPGIGDVAGGLAAGDGGTGAGDRAGGDDGTGAGDRAGGDGGTRAGGRVGDAGGAGWRVVRGNPTLAGLLALTFVFYFAYGPVEVALPVHVATDLHASAAVLGAFWTAYAVGAVAGSLAAPYLRRWPVWPTMTGIVAGWGLAVLPAGLGAPMPVSLAGFAAGGVIYAPYTSLAVAVFQDASPPGTLSSVLALWSGLAIVATPLGSAAGGPAVAALGADGTLLASALTTLGIAAVAAVVLLGVGSRRARPRRGSVGRCGFRPETPPGGRHQDPEPREGGGRRGQ
jgi:MFS family permease